MLRKKKKIQDWQETMCTCVSPDGKKENLDFFFFILSVCSHHNGLNRNNKKL